MFCFVFFDFALTNSTDQVDFTLERVIDGGKAVARKDGSKEDVRYRLQEIKRKGDSTVYASYAHTSSGVIEAPPMHASSVAEARKLRLPEGVFLARNIHFTAAGLRRTAVAITNVMDNKRMPDSAEGFLKMLGPIVLSSNMIASDVAGNIAFQQTAQQLQRTQGVSLLFVLL